MKIYQFTPPAAAESGPARPKAAPKGQDFASFLNKASAAPQGGAPSPAAAPTGASGIIYLENVRASLMPSAADLGAAGQLLNSLSGSIKKADPGSLGQVHNLEGLLYVRQSASRA